MKHKRIISVTKEKLLKKILQGMQEAHLASKGKIKSRPAKDFLDEL